MVGPRILPSFWSDSRIWLTAKERFFHIHLYFIPPKDVINKFNSLKDGFHRISWRCISNVRWFAPVLWREKMVQICSGGESIHGKTRLNAAPMNAKWPWPMHSWTRSWWAAASVGFGSAALHQIKNYRGFARTSSRKCCLVSICQNTWHGRNMFPLRFCLTSGSRIALAQFQVLFEAPDACVVWRREQTGCGKTRFIRQTRG